VLGVISIAFALDRLLRRAGHAVSATSHAGRWFGLLCGAGAGFTSTLAHAGGPPVMAYLLSRRLPKQTYVATSVFFFAAINLAKLPFYIGLDLFSRDTLVMSATLLPLVPLGVWLGMRLLAKIPERPFYFFAVAALGLSGVKLLWDGLFG